MIFDLVESHYVLTSSNEENASNKDPKESYLTNFFSKYNPRLVFVVLLGVYIMWYVENLISIVVAE